MPRSKNAPEIANRGPVALDKGTFGGTKACHFLVDMLNERNDHRLASEVVTSFRHYFSGLSEMLKLDNPHRDTLLRIWFSRAQENAVAMWERYGVDPTIYTATKEKTTATLVSLYDNVLHHRFRQASEHGQLLEKFRGKDMEHAEILQYLRNLAKYEKRAREEEDGQ